MARQKPITKAILKKLPPLYSQQNVKDPMVHVKFFTPWTYWTWYGIEFDGKDRFFGYIAGHVAELGYFSLSELMSIKGPFGLYVERDIYFDSQPLSKVKRELP